MASIDKTYTDSYKEYKEFKDWAEDKSVTFFDGHTQYIRDHIYNWEEDDFNGHELPIMNTPTWMDIYLIQNCKINFVLDRMKAVYGDRTFKDYQERTGLNLIPKDYCKNRKIIIKNSEKCKFPFNKRMFKTPMKNKIKHNKWWLQCDDDFWYNDKTKKWSGFYDFYPNYTNTAHIKSTKGVIRHLRKQYLPKGIKFTLSGRHIGEKYQIIIK